MVDLILILLSLAALVVPVPLILLAVRRRPRFGWPLAGAYLAIYVACSLSGKYVVANHGGQDWRREWCPQHLVVTYLGGAGRPKADLTLAGAVYWPCLFVDRLVWHRTQHDVF